MSHLPPASQPESKMFRSLDAFFLISERGSTVSTEIRAGLSSFLTLSYILLVHPQIMAEAGMDARDVVTATCLSAGLATLFVGLIGNFPFVMAPGLGLSTYFTHGVVLAKGSPLTWQQALGCVLLAGIVMTVLSVTFLVDRCMKHVPDYLKTSAIVGIGLLLAGIGFESSGLIVDGEITNMFVEESWKVWLSLAGLLGITILNKNNVPGAIIMGVTVTALIYWIASNDWPDQVAETPSLKNTWAKFSLKDLPGKEGASAVVTFLLVMLLDCTGCLVAFATQANLVDDISKPVPRGIVALLACGLGTCLAALTGCTPLIIAVESTAGILDGGRTGLTAVTTAALLLLSLFFAPLFGAVPGLASAGVLVLIGTFMIGGVTDIDWKKSEIALPAFLTIVLMPLSHSISNGIYFGGGAALIFALIGSSHWQKVGALCGLKCAGDSDTDSAEGTDSEAPSGETSSLDSVLELKRGAKVDTRLNKADVVWSVQPVAPSQAESSRPGQSPLQPGASPLPGIYDPRRSGELSHSGFPVLPADLMMPRAAMPLTPTVWQGPMVLQHQQAVGQAGGIYYGRG